MTGTQGSVHMPALWFPDSVVPWGELARRNGYYKFTGIARGDSLSDSE